MPGRRRPRHDARGGRRPRRRRHEDQPARARPSWSSTTRSSPTCSARPTRSSATSSSSTSATSSATSSCAGARPRSTSSRSCRRAPASCTRSTSSTWPASSSPATGVAYPDTLVGTDSHTTMVNGLGVLGWGVGGIEAEAAMLGQPVSMLIPRVVGFKLTGELPDGSTATDLVLTITEMLRKHGVVGKFVEFYGAGVARRAAGQPRHDRQHEPRVRLDLRDLPDRRRDAALPALHRPQGRADRPRRGVRQGERPVARPVRAEPDYSETLELDLSHGRAVARRAEAPAGPRAAEVRQADVPRGPELLRRRRLGAGRRRTRRSAESVPGLRPGLAQRARSRRRPRRTRPRHGADGRTSNPSRGQLRRRRQRRGRPRRGRDRRDHLLHEHLQPVGHDRRGAAGEEGRRAGPRRASPGSRRRWRPARRSSPTTTTARAHPVPGEARLQPRRLRLHDLHRQLRARSSRRCRPR